jgi:hypothetical protein
MTDKCTIDNPNIYDILPDLGSYLSDVENNLKLEPDLETWVRYQENPGPFILDVLLYFGKFPEGVDKEDYALLAIEGYLHPN